MALLIPPNLAMDGRDFDRTHLMELNDATNIDYFLKPSA